MFIRLFISNLVIKAYDLTIIVLYFLINYVIKSNTIVN
jgi:hypothetical protein